jgi:hypothetical protein
MLLGRTLARYEIVFPIKSVMPQEPPFYRFCLISYTILLGKTAGIIIRVKRKTLVQARSQREQIYSKTA